MKNNKDFEIRYRIINGKRTKVIVPLKTLTWEEGIRKMCSVLKKYV